MASRRPLPRAFAATRAALLELAPILFLVGFSVVVFVTELTGGPIYYGRDTTTFYYPNTLWAAGEVAAGRLPLWSPLIFGGYPLLADGEIGLLSPVQLGLLALLPMPLAYSAGRVVAYALASVGMYLYARLLGANRRGATIGGLAFAYGSFMVGHLQHDNILRSAAWLPWLMLTAELALQARGPRRLLWAAAGGLILALEAVGVHIQPVLMSVLVFGLALLFGPFGKTSVPTILSPSISRMAQLGKLVYELRALLARRNIGGNPLEWLLSRVVLGLLVVGLGLGLAAIQIVPLYELGLRSIRASLVTYDYATSFAVSPPQLLTFAFPAMFNFDAERHWALWATHETTLYVGVTPLLLALVALGYVRGRAVMFYALVGLVSLLLVFGDYLPIKPYTVVWNLPGFSYLRAPARFSLLLSFTLAVLSALGVTWIARHARFRGASGTIVGLLNVMLLLPLGLALAIGALRWWLRFDPLSATDLLRVALHTSKENGQLGPWHVYYGLMEFTRPDNARTAIGLGLLAVTPLVLRLWLHRPRLDLLCGALLLWLTAGDLWLFSTSFYFQSPAQDLTPSSPATMVLESRPQPFRLFVEPVLNQRYGANQLAGAGVATVNGYSSLEPPRFADYWQSVVHQDNALLDLFDVQYVLAAVQAPGSRTFEGVTYHPYDRLMSGTSANPTGQETFRIVPTQATSLTVLSAVEGLGESQAGAAVAEVTLIGADGSRLAAPLRGGLETAEYNAPEPGWPLADYAGPRVAFAGAEQVPNRHERGDPFRIYGVTIPLAQPFDATAVEVRMTSPVGRLHLYGLGVRAADGSGFAVRALDKQKYVPLQQDAAAALLQNVAARQRVSLVNEVISANGAVTTDRLHEQAWDPARQAVIEGTPPDGAQAGAASAALGQVRLLSYLPTEIVAQADLPAPGYLVLADRFDEGWRAYVDDARVTIYRANGVERLVAVPAGSHTVRFAYEPFPLQLGAGISLAAAGAWLVVVLLALAQLSGVSGLLARVAGARRR
ncbi:MAG: hypothetical protein IT306_09080 [Chloroflexi bacterium]|nr:hypothetical protein [Chloroflexota bacterium]